MKQRNSSKNNVKKQIQNIEKRRFTFWVRGSSGKPSISATFATVSFFTTTFVYIISIFENIGPYRIRPFDAAACGIYLVPIMSLYFGRRWTDSRFANMNPGQQYGNQFGNQYSSQFNQNTQLGSQYNQYNPPQNYQQNNRQKSTNSSSNIIPDVEDPNHLKGIIEEGSEHDNNN